MTDAKPKVAVIGGTGTLGSGLAKRWAKVGYEIIIGSRSAEKATEAARGMQASGPAARGTSNADAAREGEVVFLAIPWSNHAAILDEIAPHVTGKIVIDATVPLVPPKVARVQLPPETSAALATHRRLGDGARVVAGFHNVAADKLHHAEPIDCDVLIFGDEPKDRAVAIALAEAAGLRGVHCGPLANAVAGEALTSVLIGINRNYKVDGAGIRITGIGKT